MADLASKRVQVLCRQITRGDIAETRPTLLANREEYDRMYKRSIEDPVGFWAEIANNYHFECKWQPNHMSYNFDLSKGRIYTEWFKGARTNLSYNCLDRWVQRGRGDQPCFLWEGNEIGQERCMTYREMLDGVCQMANWLAGQGVRKGDVVTVYLPMLCELPIVMLACARIGAMHSVVFAGFSDESLAQRIIDCSASIVVTASGTVRGTKHIDLKRLVDSALDICLKHNHKVRRVLVVEDNTSSSRDQTPFIAGRDVWWHEAIPACSVHCAVEWMDAEDPLFLLYTSGSTGKPKGVEHTTAGYMVAAGTTLKYLYELQPGDVWWCTADCGWITGHTYITYGPLLCGATNVLYSGVPSHPDQSRCWQIVERYKVQGLLTAPTLIRSLMPAGEHHVRKHDRSSLRVLGLVGEPVNPEAWNWYHQVVGDGHCPVLDNWWQTETGCVMISPFPGSWSPSPPGCAALPFFGVAPAVLEPASGKELSGEAQGVLAVKGAWPSMFRTLYGDHTRYEATYFQQYKGYYFTGDGCRRDKDGMIWITGRVDDVLNVSGHRIGTAEVEGALYSHPDCGEAAVVGLDHPLKGQAIYAFVVLKKGTTRSDAVKKSLSDHVRRVIGAHAVPDTIHWATALPKTRSGKVMRRVLRKVASGQEEELDDLSTLSDPHVVEQLIAARGE